MLSFYLKRIAVVILLVALWFGYEQVKDKREAEEAAKSVRYAQVVAELAVAEALYHEPVDTAKNADSADSAGINRGWLAVRDSVLHKYGLKSDSVDDYVNSFEGHEEKLGAFWKRVRVNVDSLARFEMARLSPPPDSAGTTTDTTADTNQRSALDTITVVPRQ